MEKYRYAGKKMKIKKGVGIITPGDKAEGLVFEVEDYWINISGKSWMDSNGNPACMEYAFRTACQELKVPTFSDNVVYGKIDGFGHLFHECELEVIDDKENESDKLVSEKENNNISELDKLREILNRNKIKYTNKSIFSQDDGIDFAYKNEEVSAICHQYSYGGEEGLIEILVAGLATGWLKAEEVLDEI